ncbi:nuclear transport factor 2 family protein [Chlorogloeopsis fritschii PCC 9212]|uniref:nuclear transport factor 2 family protein n=1 Tax=Chlorogloeopsis fritschii TaxID=1124 RepID=UPI00031606E7|nr:nuclear transport factor 2 family protein [Chlorogloeopsis fritschii]
MERRRENRRLISKVISFFWHRITIIALAVALVLLLGGKFELASATQPNAELEIQKLTVCYALGTDAIGRGDLQEGKNIYRDCFTQDALITAIFPDGASETRTGTDAWADFVYAVFQANGYQATQHLIGTINISLQNSQATMSSYLHATHKLSETSIDVANGTYEDEVINENGQWKIRRRTLKLIDFLNLSSPTTKEKPEKPHKPNIPRKTL